MITDLLRILDPGTPVPTLVIGGATLTNLVFSSFNATTNLASFATRTGTGTNASTNIVTVNANQILAITTA
ncbi:hypothetical protein [Priestia megaterium]|uniref:hypothetical protein n=1 Tax=Priestia megaterium TaxID=1404 RepID=UPI00310172AC